MKVILSFVILLSLSACECAVYNPNECYYCDAPRICVEGKCICDTNTYYNFAGYCEQKGFVTYRNMAISPICISDQIILDSTNYDGLSVEYSLEYKEDSVYIDADRLYGYYYKLPDGDSMALQSAFGEVYKKGILCLPFFLCKNKGNELHVKAQWREKGNFSNIQDSCDFILFREK